MKVLPWILVLAFLATAGLLFTNDKKSQTELTRLRQENTELSHARAALEAKQQTPTDDSGLERKEREELIRLRNQVGQLRREKEQLGTQLQQAQQKTDQLLQTQQSQQAQQVQQLQKQNQQLAQENQEQQTVQARNQCINNLRQIDGAIQQWALENKQPADAAVAIENVLPFFRNGAAPVCPSGGIYSLTTVEAQPTCNMPGHALSQ